MRGDCAGALPLFHRAYEIYPAGLGSLRNTAECEEALGHFTAALHAWGDLQHALLTNTEAKYARWTEDAAQAAARVAPKIGTLTIEVNAATSIVTPGARPVQATDLEVSLNGEKVSPSLLGKPIDRDPGHYVIHAVSGVNSAPDSVIDLAAGEAKHVQLRLIASPLDRNTTASAPRPKQTAAWTAFGVGVASLIGAGIAEIEFQSALGDKDRFATLCGSSSMSTATCNPQAAQSINDRGNAAATWANVLVTVGAVGLASAVILYGTTRSNSIQAALAASPTGISLVGEF